MQFNKRKCLRPRILLIRMCMNHLISINGSGGYRDPERASSLSDIHKSLYFLFSFSAHRTPIANKIMVYLNRPRQLIPILRSSISLLYTPSILVHPSTLLPLASLAELFSPLLATGRD